MGHCWVSPVVFSTCGTNDFDLICSSSHKDIQEMQFDLLISNSKNPKTIALVKENIGHISDGSLSHCAESLKLGLKKAFDLKKQNKQPPGVKLRCSSSYCSLYTNHVSISYLNVRQNSRCPNCSNWMQCVGCGYNRTTNYPSCQSCRKNFA